MKTTLLGYGLIGVFLILVYMKFVMGVNIFG